MNSTLKKIAVISFMSLILTKVSPSQTPDFTITTSSGPIEVIKFSRYYYSSLEIEKAVSLFVTSKYTIVDVEISPKKDQIPFHLNRQTLELKLSEPGYYMIRVNDSLKIFLFAEKSYKIPADIINIVSGYKIDPSGKINESVKIQRALDDISGSGKILYFPPGIYKSGQLHIRSNSRIHLSKRAILNADTTSVLSFFPTDEIDNRRFIYMKDVENVEITGSGTINGFGNYMRQKSGDDARIRLILAVNSRNIKIEGLILKDPGSWNSQVIMCDNVILRNIKLLNDIDLSNTDGFDPDASRHVLIEDCFAYCGDDNVAVKATGKKEMSGDVDDIVVRGCVFLTKKSSLKVGTETRTSSMKNITFEDNDVIESDRGMALYVRDGATLSNIVFRNNRFERNYPDAQKKAIHFELDKREPRSKMGKIENVLITGCIFYNKFPRKSVIESEVAAGINVTVENLVIAGMNVKSAETAGIEAINSEVIFK